ncbi:F-box domain-containing protein [Artemisia annua]|uniref:F-box domain-containing protein n=1 Tax=Artemisia annua TaxID=35608 RepID=A0A2U1QAU2_ARTAN|nr:F-box domain-containing protein [Artemisia annua]
MVEFGSDIMYDILSRLPVKSLCRFRCVCKLWCKYIEDPYLMTIHVKEEPMPIMFYTELDYLLCRVSLFRTRKSKEITASFELKKDPIFEFAFKRFPSRFSKNRFLGYFNGLTLLSQEESHGYTFIVIHPLRKDFYELPTMNKISSFGKKNLVCGFGFDDSRNVFKIVCVSVKGIGTVVHIMGTNSWREIHQAPSYPMRGEGVFAHGCVHWLASPHNNERDPHKVIYFDVKQEQFGLINRPTRKNFSLINDQNGHRLITNQLVELDGEVGFAYTFYMTNKYNQRHMEVWVLKQKEWVMHCEFDLKRPLSEYDVKVIGFWNKDGDILMSANKGSKLFVYRLKRDILHEVNVIGNDGLSSESHIQMYQSDFFLSKHRYGKMLPVLKLR